jgi:hypothetical protein
MPHFKSASVINPGVIYHQSHWLLYHIIDVFKQAFMNRNKNNKQQKTTIKQKKKENVKPVSGRPLLPFLYRLL